MSVELHHRLDGPADAPLLALSNSLGTSLTMWDEHVPALASQFRILRYDQRGHGRTPAPPGPYTVAELGRDALTLLDRLGLQRVSLCGTSLGGMTAMWIAIHAPERIDRLVLCCTSAYLPPRQAWTDRAATVRARGMEAVVDAVLDRWFTPALSKRRPQTVARTRQALLATPPEGYAGCCEAIATHDLRGELASITAPTLVLAASADPATPPEHGRQIADSIDGARLVTLEEARHLAVVEQPEESARAVLAHLTAAAAA
jgi:3-oxoadipate enol-lactonase